MDAVKRTQFCSGDIPAKDVSPKSNHEEHYTKSNWETVYEVPGLWSSKVSMSWTEGKYRQTAPNSRASKSHANVACNSELDSWL